MFHKFVNDGDGSHLVRIICLIKCNTRRASQLNAINAKGQLILTLKSLETLVSEMGVT